MTDTESTKDDENETCRVAGNMNACVDELLSLEASSKAPKHGGDAVYKLKTPTRQERGRGSVQRRNWKEAGREVQH